MPTPRPEEDFVDTIDEIIAHLEQDPVLVQEVMGNGYTAELTEVLREKADAAQYPVYVIYTVTPQGMAASTADEEIASLVHAALDEDGIYVVHTTDGNGHVGVWGDFDPDEENDHTLLNLARSTVEKEIEAVATADSPVAQSAHPVKAAAILDVASHDSIPDYREPILSSEELELYAHPMWSHDHHPFPEYVDRPELATPGLLAVVATVVGLVTFVVGYRLLQALGARGTAGAVSGGSDRTKDGALLSRADLASRRLEETREEARAELAELDRLLDRTPATPDERRELARHSLETGEALLESEDLLEVTGALVLGRTGTHALASDSSQAYRCCYVNPLHGKGEHSERLSGGVPVPVCDSCRRDHRAGLPLDALPESRRFGADRPYFSGSSVWATTGYGTLVDDLWRHVEEAGPR